MLTNTKIAFRLAALLVLLLALMASLASLGLWGMSQVREGLRTVYEDRTVPTAQIGHIIDGYYRIRLSVLAATNAGDAAAAQKAAADIGALGGSIAETWKAYMATYLTPEEKAIADKTASAMADYDSVRGKVMEALIAGDADGSRALAKEQGGPAFATLRDRLLELTQLQNDVARAEYDNASDIFDSKSLLLVSLALAAVIGGALVAWAISRSITRPLRGIITVMQNLAAGDLTTSVPGSERRDEVGEVAQSVLVFKEGLVESERLRSSQEAKEKAALQQRRKEMLDLAATFEASVGGVVGSVTAAATQLQSTAQSLSKTAEETSQQSTAVAAASEQTTQNIQTVAAATEELTASINEISTQVAESTRIIGGAVTQANDTNAKVRTLAEAAQKIGDVVTLINTIASQTNLLALNATIEAARAGEAGKGFAVVASEVKNLATQTARATDDIGAQVRTIQDATSVSVGAISEIVVTINRVSEISTAIASAVEEQGAATQEISRNVQEASAGTAEVASNIAHVTHGSQSTSAGSSQVLGAAGELVANGNCLRAEVDGFLRTVRNV